MTVCIAANCVKSTCVVVASDRMVTFGRMTVEFDHCEPKIDVLSDTCVALSAGNAIIADAILSGELTIGQFALIDHCAEHLRERFVSTRRRIVTEWLLEPRGTTFDEFYKAGGMQGLPPELAMSLDDQARELDLQTDILLAGIDSEGAHIYTIENPGLLARCDRIGYEAIGSGAHHATITLIRQHQNNAVGLNETVFNVYCAKRIAEYAPGVGTATEMRVITRPGGIRSLNGDELSQLSEIFDVWSRPKTDEVERMLKGLPYERPHEPKLATTGAA
ncbi:MAG: hypothetical protein ACRD1R_06990 [Acidobacteriota bacterium]